MSIKQDTIQPWCYINTAQVKTNKSVEPTFFFKPLKLMKLIIDEIDFVSESCSFQQSS